MTITRHLQSFVPALTHLARFPGGTVPIIAHTRGVPADELQQVIELHFGGGVAGVTEAALQEFLDEHALQPANPNATGAPSHEPEPHVPPPRQNVVIRTEAAEPVPVAHSEDEKRWNSFTWQTGTIEKYVPLLEQIAATSYGHMYDNLKAGKYPGLTYASWTTFKLKVFLAGGGVTSARAKAFLEWCRRNGRGGKLEVQAVAKPAAPAVTPTPPPAPSASELPPFRGTEPLVVEPPKAAKAPAVTAAQIGNGHGKSAAELTGVGLRKFIRACNQAGFTTSILFVGDGLEIARQAFKEGNLAVARDAMRFVSDTVNKARDHLDQLSSDPGAV